LKGAKTVRAPLSTHSDSRNLQTNFDFSDFGDGSAGFLTGGNTGGGSTTNTGFTGNENAAGVSTSTGSGNFSVSGQSGGFVSSPMFGSAQGGSSGGANGASGGMGNSENIGTSNFTGSVSGLGNQTFGGQLSPIAIGVGMNPDPPAPAPDKNNGKDKGDNKNGKGKDAETAAPADPAPNVFTFPVATGPTGGFATALGNINTVSEGTGQGVDSAGTTTGSGNTFGSSQLLANSIFGIAGGSASGLAFGNVTAGGGTSPVAGQSGLFTVNGTSNNSFNNLGAGFLIGGLNANNENPPSQGANFAFPSGFPLLGLP
jgi:hypothetical protein